MGKRADLCFGAMRLLDVLHDVDVDIVQNDTLFEIILDVVHDVAKDHPCLGGIHFDTGAHAVEGLGRHRRCRGTLNQLEVAEGRELDCEILQDIRCLIYKQDIQDNVELMDGDVSFGINRVGEAGQLRKTV